MPITFELSPSPLRTRPTPVRFEVPANSIPAGALILRSEAGGADLPAQADGDAVIAIVPPQDTDETLRYRLESAAAPVGGVTLQEQGGALELYLPEGMFGAYHYGQSTPRPHLWPVYGPGQKRVTRNFPMETEHDEKQDHPHHRSLWTAFDEVNGVNNWAESPGHGYTRHEEFTQRESGTVFGGFTARSRWTDADGAPVLSEMRAIRLYNAGAEQRWLDYGVTWQADHGDVTFNDTKEAGVVAVRVATSMDGERGGQITSAAGHGEAECWGKPSPWCDYSGLVEGETLGIAIFDHPGNPGFPTRWHVRDYGLFATNPFSRGAFGEDEKTPFVLRAGESVAFRYRVLIHRGAAQDAQVAEAYRLFADAERASSVIE
jgi:hypothetical protein